MDATLSPMQGISPSLYPLTKDSHNTRNFMPYSFRIVCGFFNVPHELINMKGICETGPTVYSPYQRRLESLTICWCNYKGSTFYSVILRPWVLVRLESNSQPPTWHDNTMFNQLSHRCPKLSLIRMVCAKTGKIHWPPFMKCKAYNAQKGWAGFDFTWSFFVLQVNAYSYLSWEYFVNKCLC